MIRCSALGVRLPWLRDMLDADCYQRLSSSSRPTQLGLLQPHSYDSVTCNLASYRCSVAYSGPQTIVASPHLNAVSEPIGRPSGNNTNLGLIRFSGCNRKQPKLEEASTHKSATTHAGYVFVTLDLLIPK